MHALVSAALLSLLAGCSGSGPGGVSSGGSAAGGGSAGTIAASSRPTTNADGVAYFAGGCFWGVEYFLEKIDGVAGVDSGFMGGHFDSPSYEQVASQASGHLETVRVRFDTSRVSFEAIAKRFFEIHDPTQKDGQGPDIGPEYRSAVFYASPEQKRTTEELIARLVALGYDVATELRPATTFWAAEDSHQDYYARKGTTPYCHVPVDRFDKRSTAADD